MDAFPQDRYRKNDKFQIIADGLGCRSGLLCFRTAQCHFRRQVLSQTAFSLMQVRQARSCCPSHTLRC